MSMANDFARRGAVSGTPMEQAAALLAAGNLVTSAANAKMDQKIAKAQAAKARQRSASKGDSRSTAKRGEPAKRSPTLSRSITPKTAQMLSDVNAMRTSVQIAQAGSYGHMARANATGYGMGEAATLQVITNDAMAKVGMAEATIRASSQIGP